MMDFTFSPDAEKDLDEIQIYTIRNFGLRQSRDYKRKLLIAVENICEFPYSGRKLGSILSNIYRYEVEKHVIFYKVTGDNIRIIRILHRATDFLNILD
jgi:toxin ParE1/3/4